jgi:hypothetical protein
MHRSSCRIVNDILIRGRLVLGANAASKRGLPRRKQSELFWRCGFLVGDCWCAVVAIGIVPSASVEHGSTQRSTTVALKNLEVRSDVT